MHETASIAHQPKSSPAASVVDVAPVKEQHFEKEEMLIDRYPIQLKLSVGAVNDPLEHEADAMADKVMRMPETSFIQRKTSGSCNDYDDEHVRLKPLANQVTPFIQAKGDGGGVVTDSVSSKIKSSMGGGSTMDAGTRSFMENRFGTNFSDVKIHNNAESEQLSRSLDAKAFTVSNNIYFNGGQYAPGTDSGKHLLAHELTHVVQQSPLDLTRTANNPDVQRKSDDTIQLKGRTPGGFFGNMGRSFLSIFDDEPDFSDATLQEYLKVLDTGEIEDDDDSDDKARIVVRKWMANKMVLTPQRKLMLIREMLSGWTRGDDQNAILNILNHTKSTDEEVGFILGTVKPDELRKKIDGVQGKKLEAIFTDLANRKVQLGPKPVSPVNSIRKDRTELLGDGTAANKGLTVSDFQSYLSQQADWYTEPTLSAADRKMLWGIATAISKAFYVAAALGKLMLAELCKIFGTPDMAFALQYAAGADTAAQTIRITDISDKLDRVIELGKAMHELGSFIAGVVLRICIDQKHFETLVDENLVPVLKTYYSNFSPTLENPKEADFVIILLKDNLPQYMPLTDWVHDLHVLTKKTREQLVINIKDKTRTRPVLLILMSGLDWNGAFLQGKSLENAVTNMKNLALLVEGATDMKKETVKLDQVADDYGQFPQVGAKGRLGQVVIAGHGSEYTVEQITPGTGAKSRDDTSVAYDQKDIKFGEPGGESEKLIDEALQRMDPNQASIVFAGCLVGSNDVKAGTITSTATAAKEINASIKANPDLKQQVMDRMTALKIKGTVGGANASTPFDSFNVDNKGRVKVTSTSDPDIGGSKADYVKTGMEPEGALRAALETWADPSLGPAWTTNEMKKHVTRVAGNISWYVSITRSAFQAVLPAAGNVDPKAINELSHRVSFWLDMGWESMAKVTNLAVTVAATEAPILYPSMLASQFKTNPYLPIMVQEAWMQVDIKHEADFLSALEATALKGFKLANLLDDKLVDPHLANLLKTPVPARPTKGQLLLAITIAVKNGTSMAPEVKTLLTNAAGGVKTVKFPAALKVSSLLDGASELGILTDIGLAPGSAKTPSASATPDDANMDLDNNKKNDMYVAVDPRQVTLAFPVVVRSFPDPAPDTNIMDRLAAGDVINVTGTSNQWTVVDVNGKTGFILYHFK